MLATANPTVNVYTTVHAHLARFIRLLGCWSSRRGRAPVGWLWEYLVLASLTVTGASFWRASRAVFMKAFSRMRSCCPNTTLT